MFKLAIVGGGPAGMGPLVWAAQAEKLAAWLNDGIVLIEETEVLGGNIGKYIVDADSRGISFHEFLYASLTGPDPFAEMRSHPLVHALMEQKSIYPELALVGRYMRVLGETVGNWLADHPASDLILGNTVRALHLNRAGSIAVEFTGGVIEAQSAIMAVGGRQDISNLAGLTPWLLRPETRDKLMPSDRLLTIEGLDEACAMLSHAKGKKIVIFGGSHSALSAAWILLEKTTIPFERGDVIIVHRTPPRIYYDTAAEAVADDYPFTPDDICPFTKRINRFGGLRNKGRDLCRRLSGRPGTTPDPRATMLPIDQMNVSELIDAAALVVTATGYRLRTVPVYASDGSRLELMADCGQTAVDRECRLLLSDGRALPNVFGIGLGSGYRPWGAMAAEPSFRGQQNNLWLYQTALGKMIYDGVEAKAEVCRAAFSAQASR
jgi:hypothetical protein